MFLRYQQHNDQPAFNEIYRRFTPELRVFIESRSEGALAADVDDILQETFAKVHQFRHLWRPGTHVRPWLYKIAQNTFKDFIKRASYQKRDHRKTKHPEGWLDHATREPRCMDAHIPDGKADPAIQDDKMNLDELMARLPPPEAEALRLVDLEGHTIRSAAEALELPESTVWSRVRSARKHLKELGGE